MRHFLTRRVVRRTIALGLLSLAGVGGCDMGGSRGGTLVISTAGDADVLFPPTIRQQQSVEVTDLLFERLADIGPDLNTLGDSGWQPRLAQHWVWAPDSMSVTFHLDPRARWHDGRPVRASDVLFGYSVYVDTAVRSSDGRDIREVSDSLTVTDSLTCTVWFRQRNPERFYRISQNLRALPEHLLAGIRRDSLATSGYARAPVGNGPFKFVRWDQRQRIEIAAVDNYHLGRPNLDRIIWTVVPENATAVQRVFAGEADLIQMLPPAQVAEAWKHESLRAVHLGSLGYSHMLFNLHDGASNRPHPLFSNREFRRALTMATDRHAVMRNALDSLGFVPYGPFIREQWSADTTLRQLPLDRTGAERILDSLGWRKGANGMRQRAGKGLSFSLMVPASSAARVAASLVVQEQWRQIGVQIDIDRVDNPTFGGRMNGRQFDAAMAGVAPQPSPSGLRQNWHTAAITMSNGLNAGSFSDAAIDEAIDSAVNATSVAAARGHYRAAYQMLIDAAPAIWLLEPMRVGAVSRRVTLGPIPRYAWWSSLPSWSATGTAPGRADTAARSP